MESIKPYNVDYIDGSHAYIDVYVTVPGRKSIILNAPGKGSFKEIIKPRAFEESIHYYGSVPACLNHDREIASSKDVEIWEDNIGLRAIVKTKDIETLAKILSGKIVGCSFTFKCLREKIENEIIVNVRTVEKLKLTEISFIDDRKCPTYNSCSILAVTIPKNLVNSIAEYRIGLINK